MINIYTSPFTLHILKKSRFEENCNISENKDYSFSFDSHLKVYENEDT